MKQVTIRGRNVTIRKFGAIEGVKLMHKVASILGPSFGQFDEEDFKGGIETFFHNCPEDELVNILTRMVAQTEVDGVPCKSINDLNDYAFLIDLVGEILKENFGDFFLSMVQKFGGLLSKRAAAKKSGTKKKGKTKH